jgi:hypothetical protein
MSGAVLLAAAITIAAGAIAWITTAVWIAGRRRANRHADPLAHVRAAAAAQAHDPDGKWTTLPPDPRAEQLRLDVLRGIPRTPGAPLRPATRRGLRLRALRARLPRRIWWCPCPAPSAPC